MATRFAHHRPTHRADEHRLDISTTQGTVSGFFFSRAKTAAGLLRAAEATVIDWNGWLCSARKLKVSVDGNVVRAYPIVGRLWRQFV